MGFSKYGYFSLSWSLTMLYSLFLIALSAINSVGGHDHEDYLYNIMSPEEYYPIIEYVPPPKPNVTAGELKPNENSEDRPDFLYNDNFDHHRVVEFYAPWCPHCRHFKDHYIEFGKQMEQTISKYTDVKLDFYAISCTVNKKLCTSQDVHGYPTIKIFPAYSTNGTRVKYFELHAFDVLKSLGIQSAEEDENIDTDSSPAQDKKLRNQQQQQQNQDQTNIKQNSHSRSKKQLYADAYLSFMFSMRTGVFMEEGALSEKRQKTLKEWLQTLRALLPPTWHIHDVINELIREFKFWVESEDLLEEILNKYPPKDNNNEWSYACTKGEKGMGYTCGLWTLFHIMTVGLVEWNTNVIPTDDGYSYYRTHDVAEALRNFIEDFFACEVCRLHFLQEYDDCMHDRCTRLTEYIGEKEDWIQLPIWLFEAHNDVNVRLLKEKYELDNKPNGPSTDEIHSVEWPPRSSCPKCWLQDGQWDEQFVYHFLRLEYWEEDSTAKDMRRQIQENIRDHHRSAKNTYDDDDKVFFSQGLNFQTIIQVFAAVLISGVIISAYLDKRKRQMSGRHKKVDT